MQAQHSPVAAIDAWREHGAISFDPVRLRFIEALAQRAAAHDGQVRQLLDDKLARLRAAYGDDLEKARRGGSSPDSGTSTAAGAKTPQQSPERGPLGELVDHIANHAPFNGDAPAELKALGHFRRTWSRLNAHQRLRQSLAMVPDNAGPLNSQHLVHRSLTLMRDLSPQYLERFMSYVDALLWLDQANAPRADSDRKAARGKAQ